MTNEHSANPVLTYRNEVSASLHEMMEGLRKCGVIDEQTMREFDESCLAPMAPAAPE